MKKLLFVLLVLVATQATLYSQGVNCDYDRIKIGDAEHIISGLALSPDHETLAISGSQSYPFYLFDWKNLQVLQAFNIGNWYAGSSISYSAKGTYILLNRLYYSDFALNKDREVTFEIVDAISGKRVKRFEAYHSVKITADEKYAIGLTADEIQFWNLSTQKKEKSFTVAEASNSIAISPDGKLIAVSHHLYEKDAKNIPQLQRDKKTMKSALKYKQQISVFDASTFEKLYTINELYDIIYKLTFDKDGLLLMCLNIPHTKMQNKPSVRQMYVNFIDMVTHQPLRRGFTSATYLEPDFKLSHDGKLFGIISKSNQFLELHIYDLETGKMAYRFQQSFRLLERTEEAVIVADTKSSFVFLPDNQSVMMTMGNHLIKWNFKSKK